MINTLITDMESLLNDIGVYGFEDSDGMEYALNEALNVAKLKYLYPSIGETYITNLLLKTKASLTSYELYIYYAFLYFGINVFLDSIGNKEQQIKPAESSSKSKKNVSSSASGRIGKYDAAGKYLNEAYKMLSNAGYVKSQTISRNGIETVWRTIETKIGQII
jgi:hypothetical protein